MSSLKSSAQTTLNLPSLSRATLAAVIIGALSGVSSALFVTSLNWMTNLRLANPALLLFLPIAGFATGWLYDNYGRDVDGGTDLLLDEIQEPKKRIPLHLGVLVWIGSMIGHLFGASVGREGAAVQLGGCLADQIHPRLINSAHWRHLFLLAGIAAGFGSVFGVPCAGVVFALEVLRLPWQVRASAIPVCIVATATAVLTSSLTGIHHTPYPHVIDIQWNLHFALGLGLLGIGAGALAFAFHKTVQGTQHVLRRWLQSRPYRTMVGGAVVSLGLLYLGSQYAGLGVPYIIQAFRIPSSWSDPLAKLLLTALSIGSGFKGGEVTPLLFAGSTFGSWLSHTGLLPLTVGAGTGLVAILAGALNAPLACAVMAGELMGWELGLCALPVCYLAYFFSGPNGVYHAQVRQTPKRWHVGHLWTVVKRPHRVRSH